MTAPTLTEFLLARIAEDEEVARAAVIPAHNSPGAYKPHPELAAWRYRPGEEVEYDYDDLGPHPQVFRVTCDGEGLLPAVSEDVGPHIARHDPARVLAECKAKRELVALGQPAYQSPGESVMEELILCHLATPYAEHPDYQQEWKP